jgi:hypothetical protein
MKPALHKTLEIAASMALTPLGIWAFIASLANGSRRRPW